jgi:hypothetical protein
MRGGVLLEKEAERAREYWAAQPKPAPAEPACSCRAPVLDRMYLTRWLCRACGRLLPPPPPEGAMRRHRRNGSAHTAAVTELAPLEKLIVGQVTRELRRIGCEVKRPGGRLSTAQRRWHEQAQRAGVYVLVVTSAADALEQFGRLPRRRQSAIREGC